MVNTEEFTLESRDGKTKLHAMRWLPKQEEPVCIVQIVHGMNEYIRRYDDFASYLAGHGILVVGEDHLGHGESVSPGGCLGYFCENDPATVLVRDVHRLKKLTEEQYPHVPYIIMGHSMGSFILRNYMARYGTGINGAILCGTGNPTPFEVTAGKWMTSFLQAVHGPKYVSKFISKLSEKTYLRKIENPKTNRDWISTDEKVVESFCSDPLGGGFTFTVSAFHTLLELAQNMQKKKIY